MAGALGVVITTDVPVSGQHAQPVYVDDTLPIVGPSQAIVVTTGDVPQMGGPPLAVRLAPAGTPALGPALPVYVVPGGGSLGVTVLPPVNTVLPAISGTVDIGQTLTATNGTWTNSPSGYTYQWKRNGVAIVGATANTYTLTASDPGTTITVTVTATNAGGATAATSAGVAILAFLLRDEYPVDAAAPLTSPRTCDPGPGTLTLVQNDGQMSTVASLLIIPAQATPVYADLGYYGSAVTRAAGVMIAQPLIFNAGNKQFFICHLRATAAVGSHTSGAGIQCDTDGLFLIDGAVTSKLGATHAAYLAPSAQENVYANVLRAAGAHFIFNDHLVYVGQNDSTATLYPHSAVYDNNYTSDYLRVAQLGAPFVADRGLATYYDATPTANDTATSEANALHFFEWTPASAEVFEIKYRRIDDDNCMIMRCSQSGSTIKVIQRKAGVEIEEATGARTWTIGTKFRIGLRYDWRHHFVWVNGSWVWQLAVGNYNTYNLYETGCKVSGFATGEDWEIFPAQLSGAALAELQRYTNPYYGGYRSQTVIAVADGGDIAAALVGMRRGDILSLATNGTYTLGAGVSGLTGLKGGFSDTYQSVIRGNGATITSGNHGALLSNIDYFRIENTHFVDQALYSIHLTNCRHFEIDNCTFQSDSNPAGFVDLTHFDHCAYGEISNCVCEDSVGIASMDGFEVYGDSYSITFTDCEAYGVVGGFEVWTGAAPAGANKDITFLRCYSHDNAIGFDCDGGTQTPFEQINVRCVDCTVTNNSTVDYRGNDGSTLYRINSPGTTSGSVVDL